MENRYELFTGLITKINRLIKRIKTDAMAEFELKVPHTSCLFYLYTDGSLNATQLCERCESDKGAMSRTLDFLEKEGYITFDKCGARKYKNPVKLTEKGVLVGEKLSEKIDNVLMRAGEGLADDDRVKLYAGLALISDNLQGICDEC